MKGAGRGYIIIYACACGEVDKLTYHLPPTGYSFSQEEEKGIEIEGGGIQKRDGAPHGTPYSQDEKD